MKVWAPSPVLLSLATTGGGGLVYPVGEWETATIQIVPDITATVGSAAITVAASNDGANWVTSGFVLPVFTATDISATAICGEFSVRPFAFIKVYVTTAGTSGSVYVVPVFKANV